VSTTFRLLLLVILAAQLQVSAQQASPAAPAAEQEVRQLERAWLDAYEKADADAMDRIVSDDFVITFPNGARQTKAQLMKMIRGPKPPGMTPPDSSLRTQRHVSMAIP
jgi:ketosteroid isomerase-like protein